MANKEIKIDVKLNLEGGENSLNSIRAIKDEISKLETEASNLTFGSEAFEDAKEKLDSLKEKLNQFSKSRSQLNKEMVEKSLAAEKSISEAVEKNAKERQEKMMALGDNVEKLAKGMTDAFVGFSLAMGASEEDAEKFNQKMASAIGIATGLKGAIEGVISGVQLAGPAFQAMNNIIAANPIGATVVAIAALTAGIYALTKANEDYIGPSEAVIDSMKRTRDIAWETDKTLKEIEIERNLRNNKISKEEAERQKAHLRNVEEIKENTIKYYQEIEKIETEFGVKRGEKLRAEITWINREGEVVREIGYQQIKQNYERAQKAFQQIDENFRKQNVDIAKKNMAIANENVAKGKETEKKVIQKANKEIRSEYVDHYKGLNDIFVEQKYIPPIKLQVEEPGDVQLNPLIKFRERMSQEFNDKFNNEVNEGSSKMYNKWKQSWAGIAEYTRLQSERINKYVQAMGTTLNSVMGIFQAISDMRNQDIEQETRERKAALDKQLGDLDYARELELSKEGLSAEQKAAIEDKYAQRKYALELDQYNRETELKKKAFETDKKLKIAQSIISTITGAVAAFTGMVQSFPGPLGLVLGSVAAAAVAAMGAIQIATIQKQKFDAGTPPQPPRASIPQVGGGGANQGESEGMAGPSLRRIGRSSVSDVSEIENGRQGYWDGPLRAYVVTGDITSAQNKDAVIRRRSSF